MSPFLPDQTRLSQLHLRTAKLERALPFYSDGLGLKVVRGTRSQAHLSPSDESSVLLVLSEDVNAAPRPPGSTGLCRFGIRYPRHQDLARAYRRLAKRGYPVPDAAAHRVDETICLTDADGNGVELYADRPRAQRSGRNGQSAQAPMAPGPDDLFATIEPPAEPAAAPGTTAIGHLHLSVADLVVAARFYSEFLGLAVAPCAHPGAALFSAGGGHYHIGITRAANPVAPLDYVGLVSYRLEAPVAELLYCLSHRAPLLGYEAKFDEREPTLLRIRDPNGTWLEVQASASSTDAGHAPHCRLSSRASKAAFG